MRFYIGVTDKRWFEFLRDRQADEVNFWRPSARTAFRALEPGQLFLWKLHSPENFIVGGGFFVRYSSLPLSLAWEAFGPNNGASTRAEFAQSLGRYAKHQDPKYQDPKHQDPDPQIGCIALTAPFFLPRSQWIPVPVSWSPNLVQGKGYDTAEDEGREVWEQLQQVLLTPPTDPLALISPVAEEAARFGQPRMMTPRLGQGSFRVAVTESYQRRCAMTGEKTLPVLEAAHIRPYADDGPHSISNGLLLRADLHTLFDRGLITVTPEHHIEVSQQIRATYGNGREYYALHGKSLQVIPQARAEQPSSQFLDWHNSQVFKP